MLFVISACGENPAVREGLDAALASAVFDQQINLLLLGDAVTLLAPTRPVDNSKSPGELLQMAAMFGIEGVYADRQAIDQLSLTSPFVVDASPLALDEIGQLLTDQDTVFHF
jgi:sulfur relay (sulfurtransferase) DsrF/TusC family protein